jgi:hypothetical protein
MLILRVTRENQMLMAVMIVGRHRMMTVHLVAAVVAVDVVDEHETA